MSKYTNLLNEKIKDYIESYIIENNLQPYDALPSERSLAELFEVNRLTVRAALKRLRNEHVIFTVHGKGNFISPPKFGDDTLHLSSFTSGWKMDGYSTGSNVLQEGVIEAPLSVSRHLGISLGDKLCMIKRIRNLNGVPALLETSYVPLEYCPGLEQYDFNTHSLYEILSVKFDLKLTRHEEAISICRLSRNEAHWLESEENEPAFYIKATTYDSEKLVEYCITIACADKYMMENNLAEK